MEEGNSNTQYKLCHCYQQYHAKSRKLWGQQYNIIFVLEQRQILKKLLIGIKNFSNDI